jgi:hypothetical protein
MSRRNCVTIARYAADLPKRLAQSFTIRTSLRAARAVRPFAVALVFAGVARAQGTMDFSGATTLMSTFNVGSPAVQPTSYSRILSRS